MNGTVKWFSEEKGFGFIEAEGKDYFVHHKEIKMPGFKTLKEAQKVTFEPSKGAKGLLATNVHAIA
jgi:cold shock protein